MEDCLIQIFSYLHGGHILRCSAVSRVWNLASKNNYLWRLKIMEELKINKNSDNKIRTQNIIHTLVEQIANDPNREQPINNFTDGLTKKYYVKFRRKTIGYLPKIFPKNNKKG